MKNTEFYSMRLVRTVVLCGTAMLAACAAAGETDEERDEGSEEALLSGGNVLQNPSFETTLKGWKGRGATLTRVQSAVAAVHGGQYVARATHTAGASYGIDQDGIAIYGTKKGQVFIATAYAAWGAQASTGKPTKVVVREKTLDGNLIKTWESEPTALEWGMSALRVTVRPGAGHRLEVGVVQENAAKGDAFLVDKVQLSLLPTATTTAVARPSYNHGNGFFVRNGKVYDPNGFEFRMRGVNKVHLGTRPSGVFASGSNTIRFLVEFSQLASENLKEMQRAIDNHVVPMPGNWAGLYADGPAAGPALSAIVDTWVAQAAQWKKIDDFMMLNIANEWGPKEDTPLWRDAYVDAVRRLRKAGYKCPFVVDAGWHGQRVEVLTKYAQDVFDADPEKNTVFSIHIYGDQWNNDPKSAKHTIDEGLKMLADTGLPMVVGEFGPGRKIGSSPTLITPTEVILGANKYAMGWLAWAWDDRKDENWFSMTTWAGDYAYTKSADLTAFGRIVVESPGFGLKASARRQTAF